MKLPLFSKKKPNPARVLWVPAAETQRASGLTKQGILAKPLSSYPAKFDVSEDCCRLPHPGRLPGSRRGFCSPSSRLAPPSLAASMQ